MIAAGYLYKQVAVRPDWLGSPGRPRLIYSICPHVSRDFADYINFWRHNGLWLFDSPDIIEEIAAERGISLAGLKCFYYEEYEQQYDTENDCWLPVISDKDIPTGVKKPDVTTLEGFDIATFSCGNAPECSPLSCNSLAEEITVNDRCLFDTFDEARRALESGLFRNAEPGPCRIIAVYSVE